MVPGPCPAHAFEQSLYLWTLCLLNGDHNNTSPKDDISQVQYYVPIIYKLRQEA